MKKNIRRQGVFHGFIGVMAFIAYALPFMFVTRSPQLELRLGSASSEVYRTIDSPTLSPAFSELANWRELSGQLAGPARVYAAVLPFQTAVWILLRNTNNRSRAAR